jgi:hypothetical protein
MLTLSEIEVKVNELAQTIGAPQNWLPTYGYSEQTARPHVEVSPLAYYYVVTQSGQEISRYATQDIDRLLFKIFVDVTFRLAISYAEKNQVENQDIRRLAFQHQVELFTLLSPQWSKRISQEQTQTLKQAPFDDNGPVRIVYWKGLRDQGYSATQANKIAHKKYPYPNKPKG